MTTPNPPTFVPNVRSLKHRVSRARAVRNQMDLEPLESRQMMAADLLGTAFDVTGGQPLPAGTLSAAFTIKNQNGFWFLDDAGAFQVQVYLSRDQTIGDGDDIVVGSSSFTGLGAGQSVSRSIYLSLPATDPFLDDNHYYIGMIVDSAGQVAESNESNNSNRGHLLDQENVWFEGHVQSPTNQFAPGGPSFTPGATLSGAIGGSDERMGGKDIDSYWFGGVAGQTVVFDLDGGAWNSSMRLYLSNGALLAEDSGTAAPGEPSGTGESLIRYTFPYSSFFYITVSSWGNHTSNPCLLTGRNSSAQGSYTINTVVLPDAPSTPDLNASYDTGASSTDNITSWSGLKFSLTGQPGKIAQVFVDGVLRGSDPNGTAGGLYEVNVSGLTDGVHSVTANLLDPSNGYQSNSSAALTIRVDTTKPAAPAPDLESASDTGLSNSDNITRDATPTFSGSTEAGSIVELFRDGTLVATTTSLQTGAWSLTPTFGADGTYDMKIRVTDTAGNVSSFSAPTSLTLDTAGPTLTTPIVYHYDTAPHRITMSFSDDVIATISSSDLVVLDLSTSGTVGAALAYDPATRTAAFALAGQSGGILPRGNYRARIDSAGVTDVAGNGVAGNTSLDLFFLPGDANQDRAVDISDLGILATNWQGSGKTFSQGDFNYDGTVDITDLGILATQWQQQLPPPAPSLSAGSAGFTPAPIGVAAESIRGLVADHEDDAQSEILG